MTTSGTTLFDLTVVEALEEAGERAGYELRTGWEVKSAIRSLNLMFAEWANRGINLWTVDTGTIPLLVNTAIYNLPADTVDLIEHVTRQTTNSQSIDINLNRISVSTYATIPDKAATGRPIQIYIDRLAPVPTATVWPVPSDNSYSLIYWRLRRIQDAGTGVNTFDIPFRFYNAMVSGLAYMLACKVPNGDKDRAVLLKQVADADLELAMDEDRDKANVRVTPRIGYI